MTIEELAKRVVDIEMAINQATQNVLLLTGQKVEAQHHLEEAKKAAAAIDTPPEPPVE